jgi:hypothetical protein
MKPQKDEIDGDVRLRDAMMAALDTVDDDTIERCGVPVLLAIVAGMLAVRCGDVEVAAATLKQMTGTMMRGMVRDAGGMQ